MEDTASLTLGKRILYHRKRLGLTQDQLAEKMGVTAQAVSKPQFPVWQSYLAFPQTSCWASPGRRKSPGKATWAKWWRRSSRMQMKAVSI